ncbi:MAG: undecaprenyl-diphosphatase [Parcubacteria bacterium C7867-006]|nr:MAG: undecaprenyl-diphosphatase [Parcubacteria bacterium C7867-006]
MTHLVAIILGFVEGATEFLPISSSGHLIIARHLMGVNDLGGLTFDAVLQLATTLAIVFYFWKDIWYLVQTFFNLVRKNPVMEKDRVLFYSILIGTIPAIIAGLFLENYMDTVFRNINLVALTLILGSVLFWFAQKISKKNSDLSIGKGIMIGFFQCLALIPGVSRSGATISGGLIAGLTQEESVRFSFLLSIPILLGAGLKKVFEVRHELFTSDFGSSLLLGSVVAFVTGLMAINFLIRYLKNNNLDIFIYYRIGLAIAIFLLF